MGRPTCWRVLREPEMRPVLMVRVDNATPIILNREKSITLGILGTLVLWRSTKLSPGMGELYADAASMRTQDFGSWRSRNGCLIRWPAAVCPPSDPIDDGLHLPRHLRSDRSPSSDFPSPSAPPSVLSPDLPWGALHFDGISTRQICSR